MPGFRSRDGGATWVRLTNGLPQGDKTPYGVASPVVRMIPEEAGLTCDDAMGFEPEAHTMKSFAEVSAETKQNLSPADLYADRPYG